MRATPASVPSGAVATACGSPGANGSSIAVPSHIAHAVRRPALERRIFAAVRPGSGRRAAVAAVLAALAARSAELS